MSEADQAGEPSAVVQAGFGYATWLHKARHMPKEGFKKVDQEGIDWTGDGTVGDYLFQNVPEPNASQARKRPILRLLFGNDQCEFLAGGNRDNGDSETLLFSMSRFFKYLPERSGWRSWKAWVQAP